MESAIARSWLWFLQHIRPSSRRLLQQQTEYAAWLEVNRLGAGARDDLGAALNRAAGALPLISVIMPVYRPKLADLRAAISSVEQQIYGHWELCLCDDGNDDPALLAFLDRIAAGSDRIRLVRHPDNRGIAAALNTAAAQARGEVLLFLDQDDLLTEDALGEFALAFAADHALDLAYSDSDKITADGRRMSPSFKPGWSPWLLLSHMYLSHAVAMRRALFTRVGGFAEGLDGAQDYDLILRVTEQARAIGHIPRILYHWRAGAGSTALAASEKPGSIAAGRSALAAAFERRAIRATVMRPDWAEKAGIGLFQPRFPRPTASISLIIMTAPGKRPSSVWLDAVEGAFAGELQLIVIADRTPDDGAGDARLARATWLTASGDIAHDVREALRRADRNISVLVHDDARPTSPEWLAQLCGYATSGQILAGARVIGADGLVAAAGLANPHHASQAQPAFAGLRRDKHGPIYQARTTRDVQAVTAHCLAFGSTVRGQLTAGSGTAGDPTILGQLLCETVRAAGGSVLACGDVDVTLPRPCPPARRATRPDPFHNPNLGADRQLFRPTVRSPAVRQDTPVRVAVVTHNLDREGSQSTLFDLLEGLTGEGRVAPVVLSSRPGPLADMLAQLQIPLQIIPSVGRKASQADVSHYRAQLAALYRQTGVQAVLANTLDSDLAVLAAADAGLAALWWQHEGGAWSRYFARMPLWRQALAFSAFGSAYRVIQVAEATRRSWLPIATRDNFEVIRNGIPAQRLAADLSRWTRASARAELGVADGQACAVLLGSVSRRKAQDDVIRALALMPDVAAQRLRIFIVGALVEPAFGAELERLLAGLPATRRAAVTITGAVPDAALYLAAADMFVCCSRQESAPRAIVEAMAFGLPVLTTPVDGIPELVEDGISGLFHAPGDVRALAQLMPMLAQDGALHARLAAGARSRAAELNDFGAMVARFDRLLREAAWQRASAMAGDGDDV